MKNLVIYYVATTLSSVNCLIMVVSSNCGARMLFNMSHILIHNNNNINQSRISVVSEPLDS